MMTMVEEAMVFQWKFPSIEMHLDLVWLRDHRRHKLFQSNFPSIESVTNLDVRAFPVVSVCSISLIDPMCIYLYCLILTIRNGINL